MSRYLWRVLHFAFDWHAVTFHHCGVYCDRCRLWIDGGPA